MTGVPGIVKRNLEYSLEPFLCAAVCCPVLTFTPTHPGRNSFNCRVASYQLNERVRERVVLTFTGKVFISHHVNKKGCLPMRSRSSTR